jgi:twinfilin-like protein
MRDAPNTTSLTAVTYIPTNAPVRSKTLFASTRTTLVRELGIEKFQDTLFCTDVEEILDPKQWAGRKSDKDGQATDSALLSTEERELQGVRRAEDEERHGTKGRDTGVGGTIGEVQAGNRLMMKITDDAKEAVASLSSSQGGEVVQLGIVSEALVLRSSAKDVQPAELAAQISSTEPTYTFYHYPGSSSVLFIYTCPSGSKIKDRMVYASSRAFVPIIAKDQGVEVAKRLEFGTPEEVTADALKKVVEPKGEEPSGRTGGGFARPKRPGKR